MQITVLFFGTLKESFGRMQEALTLEEGTTVGTLIDHYRGLAPEQSALLRVIAVSVNQEYAQASQVLNHGDEVGLLPPVSGGNVGADAVRVELTREPIRVAELSSEIRSGEDGAVLVFEGIVRNNTRGRRTLWLDYEAYDEMALKQMRALAEQAIATKNIRAATVVHRLGRIEINEASILIAVASAHRAAAYEASRWLIDTIKKTVPIWKKEHFADGAVWVDGEPFPAALLPEPEGEL
jgi:molybdopterin synthase catalytic subunit